jgi:imidazolonepropionase
LTAFLIRNLSQIATPTGTTGVRASAMRELRIVDHAAIAVNDGRFTFVGRESDVPRDLRIDEDVDARGATALPGFVDSHTHIAFAGYRESEFNRRLRGETYEQIAASGGGIASSVRATRAASEDDLMANIVARTKTMARYGTTTAEAKSGYGLNKADELKQLRAIRRAASQAPVRLVSTCLAAHEFPPESRGSEAAREGWVSTIIGEILPDVAAERLATFCDVFIERGVFSRDQGQRILRAGSPLIATASNASGSDGRVSGTSFDDVPDIGVRSGLHPQLHGAHVCAVSSAHFRRHDVRDDWQARRG